MGTPFIHTGESAKQAVIDYMDLQGLDSFEQALDDMESCIDDLDNNDRSALRYFRGIPHAN